MCVTDLFTKTPSSRLTSSLSFLLDCVLCSSRTDPRPPPPRQVMPLRSASESHHWRVGPLCRPPVRFLPDHRMPASPADNPQINGHPTPSLRRTFDICCIIGRPSRPSFQERGRLRQPSHVASHVLLGSLLFICAFCFLALYKVFSRLHSACGVFPSTNFSRLF